MNALIIPATRNTPAIWFEPEAGRFEVEGISIPENASDFYLPVIEWMTRYLTELADGSVFNFQLSYINSTSLKAIYQMLKRIEEACKLGAHISVRWYAEDEDEFMQESAIMFSDMLDVEFEVVRAPEGPGRTALSA